MLAWCLYVEYKVITCSVSKDARGPMSGDAGRGSQFFFLKKSF